MKKTLILAVAVVLFMAMSCLTAHAGEATKEKQVKLPDAVTAAIKALYPDGKIEEAKKETEDGVMVYEVEVEQADTEVELTVTPDGTVIEEEQEITVTDLPAAAQQAVSGATVKEVSKEITYYSIKDKMLEKLAVPELSYSAEVEKDGKVTEMEFKADGTVVKEEAGDDDDDKEHHKGKKHAGTDDDDDDHDHDEKDE